MWKKIEKFDQDLVGKRVKSEELPFSGPYTVMFVGNDVVVFGDDRKDYSGSLIDLRGWSVEVPDEKKRLMAPAFINSQDGRVALSREIFESEKEAIELFAWDKTICVSWPAIPNKDGFYEV